MENLFINPGALWFASLSAAILVLYLLRLKRRRVEISSTLLWERSLEEFQANAPFQWLKKNLLLFLQLLLLALLVLSLARPFFTSRAFQGGKTVLLIDTSYSMLAKDGGKTRLDTAMDAARSLIRDMSRGEQTMIAALNHRPKVVAGFTPDKMELVRILPSLAGEMGGYADLSTALRLLQSISAQNVRIVLISDGGFDDIEESAIPEHVELEFISVAGPESNAGITGLSVSRTPAGEYELFAAISSTYPSAITRTIKLTANRETIDQRSIEIQPGGRAEIVVPGLPYIDVPLIIEIDGVDAFGEDNEAHVILPPKQVIPVTLVSETDILMESALANNPAFDVVRVPPSAATNPALYERPGVFIFNRVTPSNGILAPLLAINPGAAVGGVRIGETTVSPRVVDWDANSPVMQYISIQDLVIGEARAATLGQGARTLVDGTAGPLIVAGEENLIRYIAVLFDFAQSDFPFRAAFPIFLGNSITWLSKSAQGYDPFNAAVGKKWRFKFDEGIPQADLTSPSGGRIRLTAKAGQVGGIELNETGIWKLSAAGETVSISSNLLNVRESRLEHKNAFKIGGEKIEASSQAKSNREIYGWLILIAIFVLLGEWYIFHQRNL